MANKVVERVEAGIELPATKRRYLDLDAAVAESEPIFISYKEIEYQLPGDLPASIILGYLKDVGEGGTMPLGRIEEFFRELVGEANYSDMVSRGLTYPQVEFLVNWLLIEYKFVDSDDADGEGAEASDPPVQDS